MLRLHSVLISPLFLIGVHAALIVPRQAATSDTCGTIDAGGESFCVCLSDVSTFVANNDFYQGLIDSAAITEADAEAEVTGNINAAADVSTCDYPEYAVPMRGADATCDSGDICAFTCGNGYTAEDDGAGGTTCACLAPAVDCDGTCEISGVCPTGGGARRRSLNLKRAHCPRREEQVCGIPSATGPRSDAWECIDTTTNLESCGGCMVPLFLTESRGVDCTAIRGALDVQCLAGRCVVEECKDGYVLAPSKSDPSLNTCISERVLNSADQPKFRIGSGKNMHEVCADTLVKMVQKMRSKGIDYLRYIDGEGAFLRAVAIAQR